ncbi:MAG TPA: hypothetical protein VNO24_17400 [Blastocatellia bacterium]|nr:hypothetical protein [Blastocatellia bacterium]
MTTRKELVAALQLRYGSATFSDRIRILDEFVVLTGYHRKHAIRLLREKPGAAKGTPERNRLYDEAVRLALTVLWEAADRVCGKRLKALIPKLVDAMERHGHLELDPVVRGKLLEISAATIDRMLANARLQIDGQRKRRKGVGSAIRRSIPVRTFADWRDPPPGFFEIDMVEHCGGSKTDGEFVHTLTLTDIASGWTECVAMRTRNQMLVIEASEKVAADLPFAMLGVDSDNDTAFMNQSVFDYPKKPQLPSCNRSDRSPLQRCRCGDACADVAQQLAPSVELRELLRKACDVAQSRTNIGDQRFDRVDLRMQRREI